MLRFLLIVSEFVCEFRRLDSSVGFGFEGGEGCAGKEAMMACSCYIRRVQMSQTIRTGVHEVHKGSIRVNNNPQAELQGLKGFAGNDPLHDRADAKG